ncbi:CinA family protein [Roseiconus lacunae]|uniref:Nicotinamide-nucleotide amidohydrolase family protein n=1 Tax=Roseiconus lacunae TaxID=2605694 RepID=A0ABT7PMR8_9BACT|nr:nicotinamide-nucleotide amidohydrolase family protein [Roseiconus lacunae]MDM4017780.1 nicotinamide-nucleotide amidohydrolase family protein [Roseiconus lacunae]
MLPTTRPPPDSPGADRIQLKRDTSMDLETIAEHVAQKLADRGERLALAESCTGGLIAATLATIPGISTNLAGSMVVYQEATKQSWLGVAEDTLAEHTAVSPPVAHQMVTGLLQRTPQAELGASVTGHLGPDAPDGFDGLVFVGLCRRGESPKILRVDLVKKKRVARQREAAMRVLELLLDL